MARGDKWLEVVVEQCEEYPTGLHQWVVEEKSFKLSDWKQAVEFHGGMAQKYPNLDTHMVTIYEVTYIGGENGWDYYDVTDDLKQKYFESNSNIGADA